MRKYLNDIGIKDKDLPWNWQNKDERKDDWKQERKEYGFDERDTWSLKYTLTLLIYERLKWFRDKSPVEMDKIGIAHEYEWKGKKYTVGQLIDMVLESFEIDLTHDTWDAPRHPTEDAWAILGVIRHSLWW